MLLEPGGQLRQQAADQFLLVLVHDQTPHFLEQVQHLAMLAAVAVVRRKTGVGHPAVFLLEVSHGVLVQRVEALQQLRLFTSQRSLHLSHQLHEFAVRLVHLGVLILQFRSPDEVGHGGMLQSVS